MNNHIRRTVRSWKTEQISLPNIDIPQLSIDFGSSFSPFSDFIDLQNKSLVTAVPKNKNKITYWNFFLRKRKPGHHWFELQANLRGFQFPPRYFSAWPLPMTTCLSKDHKFRWLCWCNQIHSDHQFSVNIDCSMCTKLVFSKPHCFKQCSTTFFLLNCNDSLYLSIFQHLRNLQWRKGIHSSRWMSFIFWGWEEALCLKLWGLQFHTCMNRFYLGLFCNWWQRFFLQA